MTKLTRIRNPQSARRLDAYTIALELIAYLRPHVERTRKCHKELADQLDRALLSIPNNLCEAMRRTGDDRAHLLTVALGSAEEVRSSVDVALINGLLPPPDAAHAEQLADRFCATTYRLRQRLG